MEKFSLDTSELEPRVRIKKTKNIDVHKECGKIEGNLF